MTVRAIVVEAVQVGALGLLLGGGLTAARGLPVLAHEEAATCSGPVPTAPTVQWIAASAANALMDDASVVFVDARSRSDYEAGHIEEAMSVPFDGSPVPANVIAALSSARIVITYCDTASGCASSTRLARALFDAGLHDVRVLEGGMPQWLSSGYAAEAGRCRNCP